MNTKQMSKDARQITWQKKMRAQGNCAICGNPVDQFHDDGSPYTKCSNCYSRHPRNKNERCRDLYSNTILLNSFLQCIFYEIQGGILKMDPLVKRFGFSASIIPILKRMGYVSNDREEGKQQNWKWLPSEPPSRNLAQALSKELLAGLERQEHANPIGNTDDHALIQELYQTAKENNNLLRKLLVELT